MGVLSGRFGSVYAGSKEQIRFSGMRGDILDKIPRICRHLQNYSDRHSHIHSNYASLYTPISPVGVSGSPDLTFLAGSTKGRVHVDRHGKHLKFQSTVIKAVTHLPVQASGEVAGLCGWD